MPAQRMRGQKHREIDRGFMRNLTDLIPISDGSALHASFIPDVEMSGRECSDAIPVLFIQRPSSIRLWPCLVRKGKKNSTR